ncbi:hypothetical protein SUGI_0221050 [Cryptomeria japonica]|nr:hypothetical protein SUGI_0221050 [Cryptomeria japonica]
MQTSEEACTLLSRRERIIPEEKAAKTGFAVLRINSLQVYRCRARHSFEPEFIIRQGSFHSLFGTSNERKGDVEIVLLVSRFLQRPEPLTGKVWTLEDFEAYPALLVMFICNHCPFVIHLK